MKRERSTNGLPPGPSYPRWLQTIGWVARVGPFLERCQARYGDVFRLKIAGEGTWVMLAHPDHVRQVFTGDPRALHAGEGNQVLRPMLGDSSVLLLDEDAHMRQRKLMLPPFHGERMQRYGELMAEIAEEEIARWSPGQTMTLRPRMQAVTLEVIMRTVFGISEGGRLERLRERLPEMLDWTMDPRRALALVTIGPQRIQGLLGKVIDPVDELLYEEIRERRRDPGAAERDDVLSLLVQARYEDGEPMSDEELRDELLTLLVAGHETTATSLAWALERLLRHPDKLERLRESVEAGEDEYLDAVIKETLRLRPVLAIVARRLTRPLEVAGYVLPAGVTVTPCIYLIHRRPDVYPEPSRFLPERFLDSPPGTYTWIPFGGGVRRCLGASFAQFEMKVVLAAIMRRTRLRPTRRQPEHITRRAITLTPSRGAEAVVEHVPAPVAAWQPARV